MPYNCFCCQNRDPGDESRDVGNAWWGLPDRKVAFIIMINSVFSFFTFLLQILSQSCLMLFWTAKKAYVLVG